MREWKRVEIGPYETEVASFMYTHIMDDSHYRIVVQHTKVKDGESDLFGKNMPTSAASPMTGAAARRVSLIHTINTERENVISHGLIIISEGSVCHALS